LRIPWEMLSPRKPTKILSVRDYCKGIFPTFHKLIEIKF
jgi:hypothetical protein